ncbi:hypothetical protein AYI70_g5129 [Smittium culicis]|uniref:Uncharacterized protein n=1 Tax=Smittium culicis TaxID=133412 RepID=A0A1R1XKR6_9FUNG|nr:hypothetical protein AYI70_g7397 [Smittium culicis]OMJ18801.1 hypothetical protein AYI70_g5129 [Smittium culicis]
MRALFLNISSTVTQGRLENHHKGMELPGKPLQLFESESKPLINQDKLDALISSKKPEKRSRIRKSFLGRQQTSTQNSTLSKPVTAQNTEAAISSAANFAYSTSQEEAQPRGPPDPDLRSSLIASK